MAPKKKPAKNSKIDTVSATKKPAPKKPTQAGKKSRGVAKKPPPKKAVGKDPAAVKKGTKKKSHKVTEKVDTVIKDEEISDKHAGITLAANKKETKKISTKASGKADTVIKDEGLSDKPAGNTRAANKKKFEDGPAEPPCKTVTAIVTTKKPKGRPPKTLGKANDATREPVPEPIDVPHEEGAPAESPKRKRKTEDKWTETTDLPVPKSPKRNRGSSPSASRQSREIRTVEDFASEGWDTSDFDSDLCCMDTVDLSRIPSPFANLGDRAERFMHIINNHTHAWAQGLFHETRARAALLVSKLNRQPPGAFGAVKYKETGPELFVVPSDEAKFSLELKRGDKEKTGIFLDFLERKNVKTGEVAYFAVNPRRKPFLINEKLIGRKLVAGPLPDFAIIHVDSWAIFWWRTRAAMNYIPEGISQGTKGVEEDVGSKEPSAPFPNDKEGEGTTGKPSSQPPSAEKGDDTAKEPTTHPTAAKQDEDVMEPPEARLTWEEILDKNLADHKAERESVADHSGLYEIDSHQDMLMENVLPAVATIWEALRTRDVTYAFAGEEILDPEFDGVVATDDYNGSGVIGIKESKFIMPLFFPADEERREKYCKKNLEKVEKQKQAKTDREKKEADEIWVPQPVGHILLAVAEKSSSKAERVRIEIRDSRPGTEDANRIRERASKVATVWLGQEVEPNFVDVTAVRQPEQINACGMYTILNAWAVMLGIPLLRDSQRRKRRNEKDFLRAALEIVNLALAGFMNSTTIQAFLNVYGYCEEQDANSDAQHSVDAVRMEPKLLRRRLRQHKTKEVTGYMLSTSSSGDSANSTGSSGLKVAIIESNIPAFLEQAPDATLEQAREFLTIADGDLSNAVALFREFTSGQANGSAGAEAS